jgi:alpha-beta hydrolase superfamily lysophospholipase
MSDWSPPAGINVRGTLILLPGRGEHPGVYERFGRRIAADGYQVHILDADADADTVGKVAGEAIEPTVLAGADTGALRALELADDGLDGLLLVGLPTGTTAILAWDDELEARTACPTHRTRLRDDPAFERGAIARPVPAVPEPAVDLPVLVIHGDADAIAPIERARAVRLKHREFVTVHGGRHDALNDTTHRSVAAHIVDWLERLRNGPEAGPILTVQRSDP